MPKPAVEPTYGGRLQHGERYLVRNDDHLRAPREVFETVPRLVSWGEPAARLRYVALVLAYDLLREAGHAQDFAEALLPFLDALPPDREWNATRKQLLDAATHRETLDVTLQGQPVTLSFVAYPVPGGFVDLALDEGGALLHFPHPEALDRDDLDDVTHWGEIRPFPAYDPAQQRAVEALAARLGLEVRHDEKHRASLEVGLEAGLVATVQGFVDRAKIALRVNEMEALGIEPIEVHTPGQEVAPHRAVELGFQARAFLVDTTLHATRAHWRRSGWINSPIDDRAVSAASQALTDELARAGQQVFWDFASSTHEVVRLQVAPGWYVASGHALRLGKDGVFHVMPLEEYERWRERRPYNDPRSDTAWLDAPPAEALPRYVNVEDRGPTEPLWLGFDPRMV